MAYDDRYGSTKLIDERIDNLSISWDYDDDPEVKSQRSPVFLFTPDMHNTDTHYHIALNEINAMVLRNWLNRYLEELKE